LPVSTALTGVLLLGETLGSLQIAAFAIALAGIVLATFPKKRAASAQTRAAPL
jgi:drug/metabolite transporter (DMT)-like permease